MIDCRWVSRVLFISLCGVIGCEQKQLGGPTRVVVNSAATAPVANDIPLEVASWEETLAIVAKHKGQIVVLDMWSTWCPPCLKELPELTKIHEAFPKDVVCISLNCNFDGTGTPDGERADVEKALRNSKATFQNLMSSDASEDLFKKVGIASIPVIQVYGRDGKLAKQFDNEKEEYGKDGFTYAKDVQPFVERLVKEAQ